MPRGPNGEKRPADVIGNAVRVMRIATGEEADTIADDGKDKAAQALGAKGGRNRAESMSPHGAPRLPRQRPKNGGERKIVSVKRINWY